MRVPVDVDALQRVVQRNWTHQVQQISTSSTRLASGLRIARAVDDASGLAISQRDRSVSEGAHQAHRNIQDGIALTRIGDGALSEMTAMLQRMRVLSLQSANGTFGDQQRGAMQSAVVMTLDEMDALVQRTEANRVRVFGGDPLTMQVGSQPGHTLSVARPEVDTAALGLTGDGGIDISTQEGAKSAIQMLDEALEQLFEERAQIAAAENRMAAAARALAVQEANSRAAASRREDVDVAKEAGALAKATMLAEVGSMMMAQVQDVQRSVMELLRPLTEAPKDTDGSAAGSSTSGSAPSGSTPPRASVPMSAPVALPTRVSASVPEPAQPQTPMYRGSSGMGEVGGVDAVGPAADLGLEHTA